MSDRESARGRRAVSGQPVAAPPADRRPGRETPLTGRVSALEPLDPRRHAAALFETGHAARGSERIWAYMPYGPFVDTTEMETFLERCAASADPLWLAVRDLSLERPIGMAAFIAVRPEHGVAEIGHIWFGLPYQRSRAVTEALYLMMYDVMERCGYRRLEWKCNALNEASRRAARRLGFRHEGTFLNHQVVKGHNRDTAWYSLTDDEWPAVRDNLERWLDPANFDARGRQRLSLGTLSAGLW